MLFGTPLPGTPVNSPPGVPTASQAGQMPLFPPANLAAAAAARSAAAYDRSSPPADDFRAPEARADVRIPEARAPASRPSSPLQSPPGSSSEKPSGKQAKHKFIWTDWQSECLIEVMRAIAIEREGLVGRERIGSNDAKWERVASMMKARQFWAMTKEEKKEKKLPATFQKGWFELIDSFEGKKHTIEPMCMSESLDEPPSDEDPQQEPRSNVAESAEAAREAHTEANSKQNSGIKKRKKAKSTADDSIIQSIVGMTERVCSVEEKKLDLIRDCENRKLEIARDQVASVREQTQGFCGAMGQMAKSLDRIADSLHSRRV
ncbi:hypothetical protein R1sor_001065 [Riccia sorocarpa]|uniref:Myb-like domain-containing protein n=1 Tax=Riccia sorocarpa TaxID=122646 RepID=A0ABD3GUY2_9MARC